MNWVLGLLLFFTFLYIVHRYYKNKSIQALYDTLQKDWGKPVSRPYFNFTLIKKYFENQTVDNKNILINDKTFYDLDMEKLFEFLDRTSSKIGQQFLYYKIRMVQSLEELAQFDALTDYFRKNKKERLHTQIHLSNLQKNESYYLEELINHDEIEIPKNLKFFKILTIITVGLLIVSFFFPAFLLLIVPIFVFHLFIHYRNKQIILYYLNGVTQLKKALQVAKSLQKNTFLKNYFNDFQFIKKLERINFKTNFISFDSQLNNEFLFLLWFLAEITKVLFNLEYLVFYSFISSIKNEKEGITKLYQFIGNVDVAISVASVKEGNLSTCSPEFTNHKTIDFQDIAHPLITNCVTNTLKLTDKSLLLTGSNMSGKTTFIRTIGINAVLAQTLHFCFATSYKAPYFTIDSSIRIADDLTESKSYYLEEVFTVKDFVEKSQTTGYHLFILDEIFKGTNTVERISGGKAILNFLNTQNNLVLVSTHDIELTELLENEGFSLYHFTENVTDNELHFEYKLKNGRLKTRNAIKILELHGFPHEIITDARNTEKLFST